MSACLLACEGAATFVLRLLFVPKPSEPSSRLAPAYQAVEPAAGETRGR